ncbi:MAG: MOSC domain-containing protein [Clostridium sp.]
MAKVIAVNISEKKGVVKKTVDRIKLIEDHGIEGDAHAGKWHRQISLLANESIDKMRGNGVELDFGIFAENITTQGIEVFTLPVGTKIQIGDTVLEVTQIGKKCHNGCEIRQIVGDCVMPREGIFAKVLTGGYIQANDEIIILK